MIKNTTNFKPNYIFVGGAPRSGTTLLQNMLDSHPNIVGGPELLHLPEIIRLRQAMQINIKRGWLDEYCTKDEADKYIRVLIDSFLLTIAQNSTVSYISEKTPANILIFNDLMELYPDARFLQIIRDPRAVVASTLKVGRRAQRKGTQTQLYTRNLLASAEYFKTCYTKGNDFSLHNKDRILTIKYEALVKHPKELTHQICDFLNLPWDLRMLRPDEHEHAGEKAITNDIWYTLAEYRRAPTVNEINKWKNQLNFSQKATLFYLFRDYNILRNLGYQLHRELGSPIANKALFGFGRLLYVVFKFQKIIQNRFQKALKYSLPAADKT